MESGGSIPHSQVPASQLHLVHTPTSHFLKIHLNIILPFTPGSSKWSLTPRFPHKTLHIPLLSPIRATRPAHLILLDFITRKIFSEQYRSSSLPLCSFLHSPVTSSLLDLNILLNTVFSNTLSLSLSFLRARCYIQFYIYTFTFIHLYITDNIQPHTGIRRGMHADKQ